MKDPKNDEAMASLGKKILSLMEVAALAQAMQSELYCMDFKGQKEPKWVRVLIFPEDPKKFDEALKNRAEQTKEVT